MVHEREPKSIELEFAEFLERSGGSFQTLCRDADEVVVFGSRAIGRSRPESDWDILLINCMNAHKIRGVDFVFIDQQHPETSSNWLQSELAHHVAEYGIWMKGIGTWRNELIGLDLAREAKKKKIAARVNELRRRWNVLRDRDRRKWVTLLRRDLQRLDRLDANRAVPPSAILDDEFRDSPSVISRTMKRLFEGSLGSTTENLNWLCRQLHASQ